MLQGYVAFDSQYPDAILYGTNPIRCPTASIPKDRIAGIRLGTMRRCVDENGVPLNSMWSATVFLNPDRSTSEADLLANLLALVSQTTYGQPCYSTVLSARYYY